MGYTFSPKALYAPAYGDDGDSGSNLIDDGFQERINCCYDAKKPGDVTNKDEEEYDITVPYPLSMPPSEGAGSHESTGGDGHLEIQYWRRRLHYAVKHHGKSHSETAEAYFNLGLAQLKLFPSNSGVVSEHETGETFARQSHQYDLAVENLTISLGLWERRHAPDHPSVGRALDALALAIVRRANHRRSGEGVASPSGDRENESDLRYAERLLVRAVGCRVQNIGAWHADTVETYNKLAGVWLHLGMVGEAAGAYREVFLVRRAIFGPGHPSVAIAAHSLANCHYRLGRPRESLEWYGVSLDVYESMGLPYRHPAVAQLLKDQSRLEDYMAGHR